MLNFILSSFWKTLIFIIGVIIVLSGIIMLFTPGPGIAAIFIGLGILASEFIWAKQLIYRLKIYLKKKGKKIKSYSFKDNVN